jgi:hypothetical protein
MIADDLDADCVAEALPHLTELVVLRPHERFAYLPLAALQKLQHLEAPWEALHVSDEQYAMLPAAGLRRRCSA